MCRSAGESALSATEEQRQKNSHLLSLAKAFSWRIVATLTTAIIAFFVTGEVDTAILIGGIEFFLKIGIYYAHERLWLWLA
ncbi:MAG: DUF2061 domain-containing protein [Proteobacteria bacterium]|nr:DUF2061 domain-containing protein [Pseudomonadota bacterium]